MCRREIEMTTYFETISDWEAVVPRPAFPRTELATHLPGKARVADNIMALRALAGLVLGSYRQTRNARKMYLESAHGPILWLSLSPRGLGQMTLELSSITVGTMNWIGQSVNSFH
jgi:hypothetical protein